MERVLSALGVFFLWLVAAGPASAEERSLLLLHTNDLHDHLRPGYIGIGGLAYQSGYIQAQRAKRGDVLVLDAADFLEKGDYVAHVTRGETTMRAVALVGYDGLTIGNHDHDFGVEALLRFESILGQRFLCLNLVHPDGSPQFEASHIMDVNGVRIGLVGLIAPRRAEFGGLDFQVSGVALSREARRLKEEAAVNLVIAIVHHATQACLAWSRQAPEVDIFVAGHNHEELHQPLIVPETGAIVVQAGADGHWVGRLELVVDIDSNEIVSHQGELVLMCHEEIEPDQRILDLVVAEEAKFAPGAALGIAELERSWGWFALGRLGAEVIRQKAGADIGFFHPTQLIRNSLPAGPVDYNAIFRVGSYRADPLLKVELSGAEVIAYMQGLGASDDWGQTQWAGFTARLERRGLRGSTVEVDIDPSASFQVVFSQREWERYFLRLASQASGNHRPFNSPEMYEPRPLDFRFADALADAIKTTYQSGSNLTDVMEKLRRLQGGEDPNEAFLEPRFLGMVDAAAFRYRAASSRQDHQAAPPQ